MDDTTLFGLILVNTESAYRVVCKNNLDLNINKTKEFIAGFRRKTITHTTLPVNGAAVGIVNSYKLLGMHISGDLTWAYSSHH